MLKLDPRFRPIRRLSGYLSLEDLGLIGDGATVALIGGTVPSPGCASPSSMRRRFSAASWIMPRADTSG
jgi:hypothetical protein